MKKYAVPIVLASLFALVPIGLASIQDVPVRFVTQQVVLLLSLAAFGLVLGQFWLTRRLRRHSPEVPLGGVFRVHRIIGNVAGSVLLLHPVLMVARRFWVQESDPIDNLLLLLRSPLLLPAIFAWALLAVIVVLSPRSVRRKLRFSNWRPLHGLLSVCFVGLATWHVVAIGRHSNPAMSAFWIALATGAIAPLIASYMSRRPDQPSLASQGAKHEASH